MQANRFPYRYILNRGTTDAVYLNLQCYVDFLKIVDSSNLSYHYWMLLHMCIYKASWEILVSWPWDESRWSQRNHYLLQNSLTVLVFFKIYLILNIIFCHIFLAFWIKIIQLKSSIISCYAIHLFFVLFWGVCHCHCIENKCKWQLW